MQRYILFSIPLVVIYMTITMGACSKDNGVVSCSQDYNCLSTEKCYNGKCTPTTEVPTTKDGGIADKSITPEKITPEKKTTPEKSVKPDKAEPTASYPPTPYGADINDVIIPFKLMACNGTKEHKIADYYKDATVKVILFSVHTGW